MAEPDSRPVRRSLTQTGARDPKADVERVKAMARIHVPAAFQTLVEIMGDASAPAAARVTAAVAVLDRVAGKPAAAVQVTETKDVSGAFLEALKAVNAASAPRPIVGVHVSRAARPVPKPGTSQVEEPIDIIEEY